MKAYIRRAVVLAAALCLLPMAVSLFSILLAGILGCELNEAGSETCLVLGLDFGGFLSGLFVMGWMALFTLPLLLAILVIWALYEGGSLWRSRRRTRNAPIASGQDA